MHVFLSALPPTPSMPPTFPPPAENDGKNLNTKTVVVFSTTTRIKGFTAGWKHQQVCQV
jgi:hypothetical protein